jgi:hypothetical protein
VSRAPTPDANGVRWYGRWGKAAEDRTRCCVAVYDGHYGSNQCTAKRKPGTEFCGRHAPAPASRITAYYIGVRHYGAPKKGGICTVEIAARTAARVQLPGGRWDPIDSRCGRYFFELADATAYMRESHEERLRAARRGVIEAEKAIAEFNKEYPA